MSVTNVDAGFASAFRKTLTSLPLPSPSDPVVFGTTNKQEPFTLMTLTDDQRFAIDRAKKYALEQSIQNALNKQAAQLHQQDLNTIKRNQALILLSRIYVGSISFEIGEDEIRKTFSPFGPIKSVALSWDTMLQKHKGFAFVEFEVPEAASLALEQMNGYALSGRNLKVGRPSNAPQTGSLESELRADENTKNRVYIASVHPELTASDIQTVFEAFGKVESCTLYPDPKCPGRHRGFGYIDFENEESAVTAVSSMNCFDLAGQQLRVGRAITPKGVPLPFETANAKTNGTAAANQASASAVALAAASISAKVMSMSAEEASAAANSSSPSLLTVPTGFSETPAPVPNLPPPGVFIPTAVGEAVPTATKVDDTEISGVQKNAEVKTEDEEIFTKAPVWEEDDEPTDSLQHLETNVPSSTSPEENSLEDATWQPSGAEVLFVAPPSRVLLLENMVGVEEADGELQEEVAEECSKYGDVLRVLVHITEARSVRIFVQFDRAEYAQVASDALNQRYFAGRVVHAKVYDEERFQLHELDD
ncbi:unnamed protein product [Calicophoron daubneyi]|uniref:RRM domain-containing protein n=1 Tax=Calicophoron daubneyi TaxID=300641 RepID=A0AAV2TKX3_CALDB